MVRPTALSNCGQAFKAFAVTPPPQAFGVPSGRPSNSATFAPPRASNSAANDPAGPAPTMSTSYGFITHANDDRIPAVPSKQRKERNDQSALSSVLRHCTASADHGA